MTQFARDGRGFQGKLHPSENPQEMARFARLGELAYMDDARRQRFPSRKRIPVRFCGSLSNASCTRTGLWDLSPTFLFGHIGETLNIPFTMVVSWWAFQAPTGISPRAAAPCRYCWLFFSFRSLYLTETSQPSPPTRSDPCLVGRGVVAAWQAASTSRPGFIRKEASVATEIAAHQRNESHTL
jgi:hypothetical protein